MRNIFFAAGALLFLLTTINFVNAQNQPRPAPTPAGAEESEEILDNSFLIEEAYNQEAGIIQHIGTFKRNNRGEFLFVFTQEIPIRSERHQFSYTIPVSRNADADGGASGVGDIALSYRYQLLKNKRVAIAPRATILIPTGDARRSLGNNTVGLQFNLPISTRLNRSFVAHSNAGATFVPRARNERGERADLKKYFLGQSLVWLAKPRFNLLLEGLYEWNESVAGHGTTARERAFTVNPGARFAFNFGKNAQLVPGFSVPFGVGPSRGKRGIFFYLSFEHSFTGGGK